MAPGRPQPPPPVTVAGGGGCSIALCMIVKDEAEVIERCLASVRGLISTWVICDTGSTDGTQQLIRDALGAIPGALHERPWRNFGANRTELMELAAGSADYLLLLDADHTVTANVNRLRDLRADSYMLRHAETDEYWIKRLVRGDRNWHYVGATHEYIEGEGPEVVENLDAIVIHHHADGGSRGDKFERDRRLLTEELEADPNNPRAVFYLAQTERDLGNRQEAIALYERRTTMAGWEEEVFYSLLQIGVLRAQDGDWPGGMAALLDAWEYRPVRLEALYELATRLRQRRQYHAGLLFARRGVDRPQPPDMLFVASWVYRWGLLFEFSICAYWAGAPGQALAACDRLLELLDLPEPVRQQTIENREFCVQKLRAAATPLSDNAGLG